MGIASVSAGTGALSLSQGQSRASPNPNELSPEEQKQVEELKQTDREIRAHEQAHKTVGGPYAGAVSYDTVQGPDGRQYAVSGEVQIDASPVPNNPEATIRKMDVVVRAALAPAEPSSQDMAVARAAQQTRMQAQQELARQKLEESRESAGTNNSLIQAQSESNSETGPRDANQAIAAFTQAQDLGAEETQALFSQNV